VAYDHLQGDLREISGQELTGPLAHPTTAWAAASLRGFFRSRYLIVREPFHTTLGGLAEQALDQFADPEQMCVSERRDHPHHGKLAIDVRESPIINAVGVV
jgi:hypothetical protein